MVHQRFHTLLPLNTACTFLSRYQHSLIVYMWPIDTTQRHRTRSTLAQVMAGCLAAPSHYLGLVISKVHRHSSEGNLKRDTSAINHHMMTSSNGDIFRVTGLLCGEFIGPRWIPLTKASDAELWCCLWSAPEYTVVQTIVGLEIRDAIAPIMTSPWWTSRFI